MIAGDQRLERKINVAPEFPNRLYDRHEIATTTDVLNILGLKEGDQMEAHVSLVIFIYSSIVRFVLIAFERLR